MLYIAPLAFIYSINAPYMNSLKHSSVSSESMVDASTAQWTAVG